MKIYHKKGMFPEGITLDKLNEEINEKERKLEELEAEFLKGETTKFCGNAFVSFTREADREECLKLNQVSSVSRIKMVFGKKVESISNKLRIFDQQLVIEEPAEPSDVFWENQKFKTKFKIWRRLLSLIVVLIVLGISSYCIFILNKVQKSMTLKSANGGSSSKMKVKIVGIIISGVIFVINFILAAVINYFARL